MQMEQRNDFAERMEFFAKARPTLLGLGLCHRFGDASTAAICKLPTELILQIQEQLVRVLVEDERYALGTKGRGTRCVGRPKLPDIQISFFGSP